MSVDLGTAKGRIEIDFENALKGAIKAGETVKKFQDTAAKAMFAVGAAMAAVGVAVKGVEAAMRSLQRGADLSMAAGKFDNLTASIGSTSDAMLGRLREATSGMMSDAELIASASDMISLGLAKTEDQTVRLATVVGKLGWDMQQTVLTFANNSKMRLDALGLSVTDVEERAKKLEEQGYSTDEAFDLAVIEAGEAKIELLGDASETTAGKLDILRASVENVKNAFDLGVAEGFAKAIEDVGAGVPDTAEAMADTAYHAGSLVQFLPRIAEGAVRTFMPAALAARELAVGLGLVVGSSQLAEEQERNRWSTTENATSLENQLTAAVIARAAAEAEQAEATALAQKLQRDYDNTTGKVTRQLEQYTYAGNRAANANRQIAEETGYTVYQLAQMGMTAEEAMEQTAASIEAAAARAAQAFGAVQGDYTTELPGADEPLVAQERDVNIVTRISGPTAEQADLAARYSDELERLRETYVELTGGVGTYGIEEEKVAERIAKTAGEIAHYEGLLGTIPPVVNDVSTQHEGLAVNIDAVHQAMYDELVQAGAAPEIITAYAAAVGIMSKEQAEAALQAAILQAKIEELAERVASTDPKVSISMDEANAELDTLIDKINNGVNPAAESLTTTLPTKTDEMLTRMSEDALAAGEAVPANVQAGIEDNQQNAVTAAETMATAVTDALRAQFGVESPSTVFAEIGVDLIDGLGEGMTQAEQDMLTIVASIGEETIAAWDATIEAADEIGASIIDGVVAGAEAQRGELVAKMREIAQEAHAAAMDEIDAESPSRLFMEMGESIILGIVEGLDREKETLYDKLTEIAGKLYSIGSGVAGMQEDAFLPLLEESREHLDDLLGRSLGSWGEHIVEAMRGTPTAELAERLRQVRDQLGIGRGDPDQQAQFQRLIDMADRRNELEQEYIRQQDALKRLEEQRTRLGFLEQQVDLLNIIRDNDLDASILDGLQLGLDANMDDILQAMTEAVRQLIERTNDELEIQSPSGVFEEIGQQIMAGLARGIDLGAVDARALAGRLRESISGAIRVDASGLNPAQNVYIYGGYNPHLPDGSAAGDPLKALYYQSIAYGGSG